MSKVCCTFTWHIFTAPLRGFSQPGFGCELGPLAAFICRFSGLVFAGFLPTLDINTDWWFETILHILGMSSSQRFQQTFIFFRGLGVPPTRYSRTDGFFGVLSLTPKTLKHEGHRSPFWRARYVLDCFRFVKITIYILDDLDAFNVYIPKLVGYSFMPAWLLGLYLLENHCSEGIMEEFFPVSGWNG